MSEDEQCAHENAASYNIEFVFDADADVSICIYYQATEECINGHLTYVPECSC